MTVETDLFAVAKLILEIHLQTTATVQQQYKQQNTGHAHYSFHTVLPLKTVNMANLLTAH